MKLKVTTAANERPVLWLYGVIGDELGGVLDDDFRQALADIPTTQPIDLRINSPGGSYQESIAIYSILTSRKATYDSIVDSEAASGASLIAIGGERIVMRTGSWMMIHEARGTARGATAADMRSNAEHLDAINDQMVGIYSRRWKGSEKELRDALHAETWIRDKDAVAMGMADSVDGQMSVAAYAGHDKFGYKRVPDAILKAESCKISPFGGITEAAAAVERIFAGKVA